VVGADLPLAQEEYQQKLFPIFLARPQINTQHGWIKNRTLRGARKCWEKDDNLLAGQAK
jgi:hypothetical protein